MMGAAGKIALLLCVCVVLQHVSSYPYDDLYFDVEEEGNTYIYLVLIDFLLCYSQFIKEITSVWVYYK